MAHLAEGILFQEKGKEQKFSHCLIFFQIKLFLDAEAVVAALNVLSP